MTLLRPGRLRFRPPLRMFQKRHDKRVDMALRVLMYSFKGGAGRTVTTANVGYNLASALARRVLIIDLDMESAGAAVLFGTDGSLERSTETLSIQDILREASVQALLDEQNFKDTWQRSCKEFSQTLPAG